MRLGWCRSFHSATNCSSLNASFGCRIKARSETAGSWLLQVDLCADSGERVAVRPGGSYGDWVTNLVVDPYKESRARWLSRTGPNTRVMRGCPHSLTSTQLPIRRQRHRITPVTIARYG